MWSWATSRLLNNSATSFLSSFDISFFTCTVLITSGAPGSSSSGKISCKVSSNASDLGSSVWKYLSQMALDIVLVSANCIDGVKSDKISLTPASTSSSRSVVSFSSTFFLILVIRLSKALTWALASAGLINPWSSSSSELVDLNFAFGIVKLADSLLCMGGLVFKLRMTMNMLRSRII